MGDTFITLSDGTKVQAWDNVVNSQTVKAQAVGLVDSTGVPIGTMAKPLAFVGASQTGVTGTITTATSVVGGATDWSTAGNVTVAFAGTFAGVNVAFEASADAGTSWLPIAGVRAESGIAETTSGVISGSGAAVARAWNFPLQGYNRFRVRTTAWTSGTVNVVLDPGTGWFTPGVAAIIQTPPRSRVTVGFQGVAPATADTLLSLVKTTQGVAAAGATSISAATGKTLRLTSILFSLKANAAAAAFATMSLRSNPTGATVIGSQSEIRLDVGNTAAAVGAVVYATAPLPEGFEISGAQTIGVSLAAQATTNIVSIALTGYEY